MNLIEITNLYDAIEIAVNTSLDTGDRLYARDILRVLQKEVLVDDLLNSGNNELVTKYENLASELKALCFANLRDQEVPQVFAKDIGHALSREIDELKSEIDLYFTRFVAESEIQKQQSSLLNNLLNNNQRITENSILVDDGRKIAPTVGNWIKYYYKKVGGQARSSRLKMAEFFSHDDNVTKLIEEEKKKIKTLIDLQEYLRRPVAEVMLQQEDILLDMGDDEIWMFKDGEFMYFESEKPNKAPEVKAEDEKVEEIKKRSSVPEVSKAFRERRKITELKPFSGKLPPKKPVLKNMPEIKSQPAKKAEPIISPIKNNIEPKKLEKPTTELAPKKNNLPELVKSKIPAIPPKKILTTESSSMPKSVPKPAAPTPTSTPTPTPAPAPAPEMSLEEKVKKMYEGDQAESKIIYKLQQELENNYADDVSVLVDEVATNYFNGKKEQVIAAFYSIANNNAVQQLMEHPLTQKILESYKDGDFPELLRAVFEGNLKLPESEAARLGIHIATILKQKGNENYSQMAYFDMASENFAWAE